MLKLLENNTFHEKAKICRMQSEKTTQWRKIFSEKLCLISVHGKVY